MGVEGTSSGTPRIVCDMYGLGLDTTNLYIYIFIYTYMCIYLCIFNVCIAFESFFLTSFLGGSKKNDLLQDVNTLETLFKEYK